jgi:Subtilase family
VVDIPSKALPHLIVEHTAVAEAYTPRGWGPRFRASPRGRQAHAARLIRQLGQIRSEFDSIKSDRSLSGFGTRDGLQIEFESLPGFELKFESLDLRPQGIELLSVSRRHERMFAVCFVPDGKLDYFVKRIEQYRDEDTRKGRPKNAPLVANIESIRLAAVDALWTDDPARLPGEDETRWWEIWLRKGGDAAISTVARAASDSGIELTGERLSFPERTILTARGTKRQLSRSIRLMGLIAELREAKKSAAEFVDLPPIKQFEIASSLLNRLIPAEEGPAVCLLDTGTVRHHPLLSSSLAESDCHAYKAEWGSEDQSGHGTSMAGLALLGSLVDLLSVQGQVHLETRLESVKILDPPDPNPPHLYGAVTIDSVLKAEGASPERSRSIAMAVTAAGIEKGEPSTWSAALDKLTSGQDDDKRRLLFVSAGNTSPSSWHNHPKGSLEASIEDPGQSWNALTVGACTKLTTIPQADFPGWSIVAPEGDVSPFSRTSATWQRPWPIKPEILYEGGNCAIDPATSQATELDALSLLTTYHQFNIRPFTTSAMTSAANALAARDAAILQSRYSNLWPESIRGLLVHSAKWTDEMKARFEPLSSRERKERLLRYCGYGAPNFRDACWSASNTLTLIAQDDLQPFEKRDGDYKTKDINLHSLPWPTDILKECGDLEVELRVTLSYFIEPNPGRRGWRGRYRYASHALRFEVKKATETPEEFRARVNLAARADDDGEYVGDSDQWALGPTLRHYGSIHSDWWSGTAADCASKSMISVFPVVGWWRERAHLQRWNRRARYSLIVTIRTPEQAIDIYTPVAAEIAAQISV